MNSDSHEGVVVMPELGLGGDLDKGVVRGAWVE